MTKMEIAVRIYCMVMGVLAFCNSTDKNHATEMRVVYLVVALLFTLIALIGGIK